jgi:hypothetical protein
VQVPPGVRKVNRTGVPGSPAKRCAGNTAGFECPAFLAVEDEPARWPGPVWKAGEGGNLQSFDYSVFRHSRPVLASRPGESNRNENLPGGRHRPESGWPQ